MTLKPTVLSFLLALLFTFNSFAQTEHPAIKYRTGFWNNYSKNPDSAVFYAKRLINEPVYWRQALHQDLFSYFLASTKKKMSAGIDKTQYEAFDKGYNEMLNTCYVTLQKLHEGKDRRLAESVNGVFTFASIQRSLADSAKTANLVIDFTKLFPNQKNLYENATATYALFIYKSVAGDKRYNNIADELLSTVITKLAEKQFPGNTNGYTPELKERAWFRYISACANYFKANRLLEANKTQEALNYYRIAADFSADLSDMNNYQGYFTEYSYLGEAIPNQIYSAYLSQLDKTGADKNELLRALAQMAFRNPIAYKGRLKSFFTQNFNNGETFDVFWKKQLNEKTTKAPTFSIKDLAGKKTTLASVPGKWKLIDFWGTWCGPCRAEHPDLEKLYQNKTSIFSKDVDLITIACQDTEEAVVYYQARFNYTFPVALSDEKITKTFQVTSFPTKILITPEGNYLTIPFNADWVKYIELYVSN